MRGSFEGGAAKTSGSPDAVISCSKSGMPTQIYRLADGTAATLNFSKPNLVALFDAATPLEPDVIVETPTAIITRFADRGRDRHAREDTFHTYDHYLTHYWTHRTATIEIVDEVAKGGTQIRVNVVTQWKLESTNCRAFYRGIGTVAEYHSNNNMERDPANPLKYHTVFKTNPKENNRPIKVGDRMEMEVSRFLDGPPEGRENYYGTTVLYVVGQGGLVPWEPRGVFGNAATEREDSYPVDKAFWTGCTMTLPQQTSNEPQYHFIQMAPSLAPQNGQVFVLGRRVHHTNFVDGSHDEPDNGKFPGMEGKAGPHFVNGTCNACHANNGRGPEAAMQGLAEPDDANKDGISGRMRIVSDYRDGLPHLGRFGWKAGKATVREPKPL